jgi:hypothetical protein
MDISIDRSTGEHAVRFELEHKGQQYAVRYASDDVALAARPEAAVAGLLLVAMAAGKDIHVDAPIDPIFHGHLETVQDVYTTWSPSLSRTQVTADGEWRRPESGNATAENTIPRDPIPGNPASGDAAAPGRSAMFFSGGVDSFYTFLKRREEIDALVFVHGFDIDLDDTSLRQTVSRRLREVADAFDTPLIEVETTLRGVTERKRMVPEFHNWEISHGSALASVAHLLSDQFNRIYIPATHTYKRLYPFGSHPLLDPLWSSSDLSVMCDGCEANRIDKCALIGQHEPALNALRVCWKNKDKAYNCGRCEKCMRTMLILKAVGAWEACNSFERDLTPRRVAGIWIRYARWERYYKEVYRLLAENDTQPELQRAIKGALYYSRAKRTARSMYQWTLRRIT